MDAARLVSVTDVSVLLLGETGTGKELLAGLIHRTSRRSDRPLVSVNCAALPDALVESELFGHRKGAFTGADRDYAGRISAADRGTLFLDEIGELPWAVQAKLLRFLESGECQPVGHSSPKRVDVRLIAATHQDLEANVRAGRFRADLYYRLNVVPLTLPRLCERTGDIPSLVRHLSDALAARYGLAAPTYGKEAMAAFKRYPWPGNVRELRNVCERLLVLLPGQRVVLANLPREIRDYAPAAGGTPLGEFRFPDNGIRLDELERQMIAQALARTGGNRSRAARLLGLTRDTLIYRMKKHAIGAST